MGEQQESEGEKTGDEAGTGPKEEQGKQDEGTGSEGETGGTGFDALPAKTQSEIKALRAEAAKLREARNAATKEAQDGKALLESLTKIISGKDGQELTADELQTQLAEAKTKHSGALIELAVLKTAGRVGGDAEALLDSRTFMAKIGKLDPSDDDFTADVEAAIKDAVKDNPKLTAGTSATRSGGEIAGGTKDKGTGSWADAEKIAVAGRRRF